MKEYPQIDFKANQEKIKYLKFTKHSTEQFLKRLTIMYDKKIIKGRKWLKVELDRLLLINSSELRHFETSKIIYELIIKSRHDIRLYIDKKYFFTYRVFCVGLEFVILPKSNSKNIVLTTNIRIGKKYNNENFYL